MALSGDICKEVGIKWPSIRFANEIQFTNEGLITELSEDSTNHRLFDVFEVIDGNIDSILPLIGHKRREIRSLIKDNVLMATEEVVDKIKTFGPRSPATHLLVENNRIYGIIVDDYNNCRVVGRITSVVPQKGSKNDQNVAIVGKQGFYKTCRSKDCDLKALVESGVIFSIISERGFAFIQTNDTKTEDFPDLVLVLNKGYILFEDLTIDWIRLQIGLRINEFKIKKTTIDAKECIVTFRGGYIREDNALVFYGSQNSVLDFFSFHDLMLNMNTIGLESGQHFPTEDSINSSNKSQSSTDLVWNERTRSLSQSLPQEVDDNRVSSESIDSEYDNISPDSFS